MNRRERLGSLERHWSDKSLGKLALRMSWRRIGMFGALITLLYLVMQVVLVAPGLPTSPCAGDSLTARLFTTREKSVCNGDEQKVCIESTVSVLGKRNCLPAVWDQSRSARLLRPYKTLSAWLPKNNVDGLLDILTSIAGDENEVIMAPLAGVYIDVATNYVLASGLRNWKNVLILTASEEQTKHMRSMGVATYNVASWMDGYNAEEGLGLRGSYWIDPVKAFFTGFAVSHGFSVIVSGLDVVFQKYPFDHVCRDACMEIQADISLGGNDLVDAENKVLQKYGVNADLFYMPSTSQSGIAIMDLWLEKCVAAPNTFTQSLLNNALEELKPSRVSGLGPRHGSHGCRPSAEGRHSNVVRLVAVEDWPFITNNYFGISIDPVAVHVTGVMQKIYKMMEHGLWVNWKPSLFREKYMTYDAQQHASVQDQVTELKDAFALATALKRVLIAPRWLCATHRIRELFHLAGIEWCSLDLFINVDHLAPPTVHGELPADLFLAILPHRILATPTSQQWSTALVDFAVAHDAPPRSAAQIAALLTRKPDVVLGTGSPITEAELHAQLSRWEDVDLLTFRHVSGQFRGFDDPAQAESFEVEMSNRLRPSTDWVGGQWKQWVVLGECVPGTVARRVHDCRWVGENYSCLHIAPSELKNCTAVTRPAHDWCPRYTCSDTNGEEDATTFRDARNGLTSPDERNQHAIVMSTTPPATV